MGMRPHRAETAIMQASLHTPQPPTHPYLTFPAPSWTRGSALIIAHVSSYWSTCADKGPNKKQRLNKPKLLRKDSKQETDNTPKTWGWVMTGLAVTCLTHLSVQADCVKKKRTCSWGFRVRCWAKVTVCLWSPWWICCVFARNGLVSVVSVGGNREATVKAQEFSFAKEKWCRRKQRGHTNLWETGQRSRKTDLNSLLFYGWWTSTWPSALHHRATLSG